MRAATVSCWPPFCRLQFMQSVLVAAVGHGRDGQHVQHARARRRAGKRLDCAIEQDERPPIAPGRGACGSFGKNVEEAGGADGRRSACEQDDAHG